MLHGLLQLTDLPKVGVLTRKKSGMAVPRRLLELSDFLTPPSSKGNSSAPRPASTDGLAFSAVLQNLQRRSRLSRWCIGDQLKIHVLSTTQVGGLSFTEKSFHVVRASVAQCVCLVSSGQRTEGRCILFLPSAFSGATFALRHASSFSWLYGLHCKLHIQHVLCVHSARTGPTRESLQLCISNES